MNLGVNFSVAAIIAPVILALTTRNRDAFYRRALKEALEDLEMVMQRQLCPNCLTWALPKCADVCPDCGHLLKSPIQKEMTNPDDLTRKVMRYALYGVRRQEKSFIRSLFRAYGKRRLKRSKGQLVRVILLSYIAIALIFCAARYTGHPRMGEIQECIVALVAECMLRLYGENGYHEAMRQFRSMWSDYGESYRKEDWTASISEILQQRIESAILRVPGQEFAAPDRLVYVPCYVHLYMFLPPLKVMLDKWVIE